jgi:hypothetical protein
MWLHRCAAGVPTEITFFGLAVARDIVAQRGHASLVIANNVLAHVPDVNDLSPVLRTWPGRRA